MLDNLLTLATSAAGLGIIGLLSAPSGASLTTQLRTRQLKSENDIYEDKDGKSTPEAVKAFSTKVPRAIVLIWSFIGLGISIALAILTTLGAPSPGNGFFVENWVCVGAWVSSQSL